MKDCTWAVWLCVGLNVGGKLLDRVLGHEEIATKQRELKATVLRAEG
jgi:hypothetical protein